MAYGNVRVSRLLKKELAWAIDKWLLVISNTVLFKTVMPPRIQRVKLFYLENNIVCFAIWSFVAYSN